MFENDLVARLKADAGITVVVAGRVYPVILSQTAIKPALIYEVQSAPRDHTLDGSAGIVRARVKLTVVSPNFVDCQNGGEAIRNSLDGFRGVLSSAVKVYFCEVADMSDGYEEPADDSDQGLFWRTVELQFTYAESLPTFD